MSEYTPNDCICGKRPTILGKAHIAVLCIHCSRSGAGFRTEEAAIIDWNQLTAAPDLLEACKYMVKQEVECPDCKGSGKDNPDVCSGCGGYGYNLKGNCRDALKEMKAAIAKTEKI